MSLRDARRLHHAGGNSNARSDTNSNPHARAYRIARQSGLLNLSTREIKSFPREILRLHELAEDVSAISLPCAVCEGPLTLHFSLQRACMCAANTLGRAKLGLRTAAKS